MKCYTSKRNFFIKNKLKNMARVVKIDKKKAKRITHKECGTVIEQQEKMSDRNQAIKELSKYDSFDTAVLIVNNIGNIVNLIDLKKISKFYLHRR